MIEVSELTKDYGSTRAVDSISFRVEPGEIVGFLGPNGAGKTTTLRILTGFLPATRGRAEIGGFDVFHQSLEARRRTGYLPENVPLYPELRVREYLRFRGNLKGVPRSRLRQRIEETIAQCGLGEMAGKTIGALSRGYRQRVGLADALLAEPPALVLDEPTTGLDPLQRIEMKKLIQSLAPRQTILFSSHILPEVESLCRRVILIHRGRIVADGTPADLVAQLGGENQYRVEFERVSTPADAVLEEIRKLPGVLKAEALAPGENGLGFRIESSRGSDPRAELFRLAAGRGWILRDLSRDDLSLEEIFARLTLGGEAAPGGVR